MPGHAVQPKPESIAGYRRWLCDAHRCEISTKTETYYGSVTSKVAQDFCRSPLWQAILGRRQELGQRYFLDSGGYSLFQAADEPVLLVKPFVSFFEKTFRKNVLLNEKWPAPPSNGWVLPENWFERINDVVRTLLVVKYLDGVRFLLEKLAELCAEFGLDSRSDLEARDEGYYAAHFYVAFPCSIPKENWDTRPITLSVEIQITTQLQEVIRKLTHEYYETRRIGAGTAAGKWQWNYSSDEFTANYMGHILHYVEGMIMDVRSRGKRRQQRER